MSTKRYPLTISPHLDEVCRKLVEGDKHFRGSRNQFYIEAIEQAVVSRLGEGALEPGSDVSMEISPEPVVSPTEAVEDTTAPAPSPLPPKPTGRKPMLEYRAGAIRNASNKEYKVLSAPGQGPEESDEVYFNRIKDLPGVMFQPVQPDFTDNPLASPLVTGVNNEDLSGA